MKTKINKLNTKLINCLINKKYFNNKKNFLKIFNRNIIITKNMIGSKLAIYNGKYFIPVIIQENMVNHLLGSLSFSYPILLKKKEKIYKKK